jgi:putative Holliday junction resolvase
MVDPAAVSTVPYRGGAAVTGRILAVDPGEKRLGIAISDPTGTIAGPLQVLHHVVRAADAAAIARLAEEYGALQIVIGWALDDDGKPTPQARHAERLAEAVRAVSALPVIMWDESGSTQAARSARLSMGVSRRKRSGHLDEIAATVILQSYLESLTYHAFQSGESPKATDGESGPNPTCEA